MTMKGGEAFMVRKDSRPGFGGHKHDDHVVTHLGSLGLVVVDSL